MISGKAYSFHGDISLLRKSIFSFQSYIHIFVVICCHFVTIICSLWDRIENISGSNTAFNIHGDEGIDEVSFSELKEKSKKVAHFLTYRIIGAEAEKQRVGILVRNSAEGVMMILGTKTTARRSRKSVLAKAQSEVPKAV